MANSGTTDYNELFPIDAYSEAVKLSDKITNAFINSLTNLKSVLSANNKSSISELKELKTTLESLATKKVDLNNIFIQKEKANESIKSVKDQREAIAALVKMQELARSSTDELKNKYDQLKKTYNALKPAEDQNWAILNATRESLKLLGVEIKNRNKELETAKKNVDLAAGSYDALRKELDDAKTSLKGLSDAFNPATGALNKANKEAVDLQNKINTLDQAVKKMDASFASSKKVIEVAAGSYKALDAELGSLRTRLRDLPNAFNPVTGALNTNNKEAVELHRRITTLDTALKQADGSMGNYHRNVGGYTKALGGFGKELLAFSGIMLGIAGVFQAAKFVADANVQYERLTSSLKVVSKSTVEFDRNMQFLNDTTEKLGLDFFKTGDAFKQFAASATTSGLSFQQTRDIFFSVSAASAKLKLSSEQTERALLALSQMAGKGKVSAEELRQQLGEALPGANALAARALGVTTAELEKMLQKGEVISSDFLPKFAKQLDKTFGGAKQEMTGLIAESNRWNTVLTQIAVDPNGGLNAVLAKIVAIGTQSLKATDTFLKFGTSVKDITLGTLSENYKRASIEIDLKKEEEFRNKKKQEQTEDIATIAKEVETKTNRINELKKLSTAQQELYNIDAERQRLNTAQHKLRRMLEIQEEEKFFTLSLKQRTEYNNKLADEATRLSNIAEKSGKPLDVQKAAVAGERSDRFTSLINNKLTPLTKDQEKEAAKTDIQRLEAQIDRLNAKLQSNALAWANAGKEINKFQPDQKTLDKLDELNAKLAFAKSGGSNKGEAEYIAPKPVTVTGPKTPDVVIPRTSNPGLNSSELARLYSATALHQQLLEAERNHQEQQTQVIREAISIRDEMDRQQAARRKVLLREEFNLANEIAVGVTDILQSASQERINSLEREKAVAVENAGSNKDARLAIEADYNKKILAEKRKQAKIDKDIALFNIALKTAEAALAVASTGGGTYYADYGISAALLTAFVIAQGAIQAAFVLAKPLPAYAKGTGYAKQGPAIVGEQGFELIEENGQFRVTGDKPELTHLQEGAKVHTHEQSKKMLYSDRVLNNIRRNSQMQYYEDASNKIHQNQFLRQAEIMQFALNNSNKIDEADIERAFAKALRDNPEKGIRVNNLGRLEEYMQQGGSRTNLINRTLP